MGGVVWADRGQGQGITMGMEFSPERDGELVVGEVL